MFVVILVLGSWIQAHFLLENPKDSDFVTTADIKLMENPRIRKALKYQCEARQLDENFPIELYDHKDVGAWVLALHISRQDVRAQRKKEKVID